MPVPALRIVPKGTVVKLSLKLPGSRGGFDGFQWTASNDLATDQAAAQIEQQLVRRFVDQFLAPEE